MGVSESRGGGGLHNSLSSVVKQAARQAEATEKERPLTLLLFQCIKV